MTDKQVLRCAGLVKRFGELTAVDGVGFSIAAGETYGLLGPNGAGKTTTISMVCGLLARDAGEVEVAGRPIGPGSTDAKAAIGLVPQDIALYPDLSARENLRFFGKLQGMSGRELDRRISEVLEVVGLADRAKDRIDTFGPGGYRRRFHSAVSVIRSTRPTRATPNPPDQRRILPSASSTFTSPRFRARMPASILDRSPTTTQVSASGWKYFCAAIAMSWSF